MLPCPFPACQCTTRGILDASSSLSIFFATSTSSSIPITAPTTSARRYIPQATPNGERVTHEPHTPLQLMREPRCPSPIINPATNILPSRTPSHIPIRVPLMQINPRQLTRDPRRSVLLQIYVSPALAHQYILLPSPKQRRHNPQCPLAVANSATLYYSHQGVPDAN